jgi:adenosylcobinamide-phosphate synthase
MIELTLHDLLSSSGRYTVALGAFALTAVAGILAGPRAGNANPWFWLVVDTFFGRIGNRLDRSERKAADLIMRGFFFTLVILFFALAMGFAANRLAAMFHFYRLPEMLMLSLVLTSGSVWYALMRVYAAMKQKKSLKGAFYTIARSTRIDLSAADDYAITRTGMGLASRAFDKGLVAPLFWYLLCGLPGAFLYAGIAACAWHFGRMGFTKGFGRIALWLEELAGIVPMIVSGMLMALAGLFTPTGGMTRAFFGQIWGAGKAPYAQGGLPLTAMAYSLNISLGGPATDLEGWHLKREWVGPKDASARLEEGHLRRGIYISLMAHLLLALCLLGLLMATAALSPDAAAVPG